MLEKVKSVLLGVWLIGLALTPCFAQNPGASPPLPEPSDAPRALPAPSPVPVVQPVEVPLSVRPGINSLDLAPKAAAPVLPITPVASSRRAGPPEANTASLKVDSLLPTLMGLGVFACVPAFLFLYVGLTRAKNCGHTATVVLTGALLALLGFWAGGFAVLAGGSGAVAANGAVSTGYGPHALDHELGFMAGGHQWSLMGGTGFFLVTEAGGQEEVEANFFAWSGAVVLAVLIALGAGLERGRLSALGAFALLAGAVIVPAFGNWVWGGGWLAHLGREFGWGQGVLDFGGAAVVHEAGGTLALVIALAAGPRRDRFVIPGRGAIPGHHLPFVLVGTTLVLFVVMVLPAALPLAEVFSTRLATLLLNPLLAAGGGLIATWIMALLAGHRADPIRLCRGLLGGAVGVSAGAAIYPSWAAFAIGLVAAAVVEIVSHLLIRARVDDVTGTIAVHGGAGAWALLALGLLDGPNQRWQGLGGNPQQLAAQAFGALTCFIAVFLLGYVTIALINRIVGLRVDPAEEATGLDAAQISALGYQADED